MTNVVDTTWVHKCVTNLASCTGTYPLSTSMLMEGGSNTDISISNTADSAFATTLIPKYIFIKMIVYTTDG